MMSSMWRAAAIIPMLLVTVPSSSTQYTAPAVPATAYAMSNIASSLNTWRALRQSSGYRFSNYASFMIANPDWPDQQLMRRRAEEQRAEERRRRSSR